MQQLDTSEVKRFAGLIGSSDDIVLITHLHPDGDAIGSTLGMMRFLMAHGKKVSIVLPTELPETLSFVKKEGDGPILTYSLEPEAARNAVAGAGLLICQDFNSISRAEGLEGPFAAATCPKVLIDHHIGPDRESFDIVFSETEISSASELVFWVLLALPEIGGDASGLPKGTLEALMTGMTTDTNNFGNSVFPTTLQMASICLEQGVDRDAIVAHIYNEYREERYRLLGYILTQKLHITPLGVAYVVLSQEELDRFGIQEGDTEAFVNIPLGMAKVAMSLLLKEQDGRFRVSIRSKRGISANMLARQWFNGGGHEQAAGGRLDICPEMPDAEAAERYIVEKTNLFLGK